MKILLAVDGSPCTRKMLAYIAAHDELLGAGHQYTALTVVTPIPQHAASYLPADTIRGYYHEQAEQVLQPVREFAQQNGWTLDARQIVGHPGEAVAELAESGKYDLVIMGSHGHGALTGAVLGSVATRVLAHCKTPVLIVR
jgi:nucleotide-binding universal stress UspA family protein